MNKSAPLSMRLDSDVKEALRRLAEKDNRTLTNYVETLIVQHVRRVASDGLEGGSLRSLGLDPDNREHRARYQRKG